jgi:transforming growth factor-beta-induced protein
MAKAVKFSNKGNMAPTFPNKANKSPKGPGGGKMGSKGAKKGMNPKASKKMKAKKNKKNKRAKNSKKGGLVMGAPTPAPTPAPTRNPTRTPTRPPTPAPTSAAALVGDQTITGFVRSNPSTQDLFTLLERANFAGVLDNPAQNVTLFAPNDNAFAALDPLIRELLFTRVEFIPHLQDFLLYHLSVGKRVASSFPDATIVPQFNNEGVAFLQEPFRINGIPIVSPNNEVSNGIVHIIQGSVLRPSWIDNTIAGGVSRDPELSIFWRLLRFANLAGRFQTPGDEITMLAPTNTAFINRYGSDAVASLGTEANRATLTRLLLYHVVDPIFTTPELSDGQRLLTVETGFVQVSRGPDFLRFNAANTVQGDILFKNGVVHKIDAVPDPVDGR